MTAQIARKSDTNSWRETANGGMIFLLTSAAGLAAATLIELLAKRRAQQRMADDWARMAAMPRMAMRRPAEWFAPPSVPTPQQLPAVDEFMSKLHPSTWKPRTRTADEETNAILNSLKEPVLEGLTGYYAELARKRNEWERMRRNAGLPY